LDKLLIRALQVANEAFDVPTVEKALADSDWLLRITAVNHFGNRSAGINEWKPLLPQMEKLAVDDDASVRSAADERLREFPGKAKFLAERETNETSAVVVLRLLRNRYVGDEFKNQFLARFLPLLSHPDENVRDDALLFIGFNSHRAPMWQMPFGTEVFDRLIVSTRAKSAKERAAAAYALTDIRQIDKDRSREAFLHLVTDADQDVRWRIAWGLSDQLGREDVKRAIAVLLKDKSLNVRYETILAAGAQRFIPELKELSKGPDPRVAQSATEKLSQLAADNKN
jgi:HEAT repeat protein